MRPWTHPAAAPPQLPSARSWASLDEARRASDDLLVALLEDIPTSTGSRQIDAFISALAEHIALERGVKPPAWTQDPRRSLDQSWFPSGLRSLHAMALVESPTAFWRRGVFITAGALERC